MAGGLNDIIARLEEQKSAIERALSALREIEGYWRSERGGKTAGSAKGPDEAQARNHARRS